MAKFSRKRAATSQILDVFIGDSAATDGSGKSGLSSASAGLIIAVKRELSAAYTVYSQAGGTIETITTIGTFVAPTATKCRFKEIDATNAKGKYQVMLADALFDASDASRFISGIVWGASGAAPTPFEIELTADDNQVAKPTNFNLLSIDANGRVDLVKVIGATINALIAGRLDVNLGTSQAGSIINGAHASAELTNIANAFLDDAIAGHNTAGTVGKLLLDLQTGVTVSAASITAIATGVAQRVYEGTITLEQAIRLILASTTGKLSGAATTTVHIRDVADSKDRVLATVDASGNRTAVTLDPS